MIASAEGYITASKVASQLDVHVYTVLRWIRQGVKRRGRWVKLPARKFGGRWRIHTEDLSTFIEPNTAAAAPVAPSRRETRRNHHHAKRQLEAMGILTAGNAEGLLTDTDGAATATPSRARSRT